MSNSIYIQPLAKSFQENSIEEAVIFVILMRNDLMTASKIVDLIQQVHIEGDTEKIPDKTEIRQAIENAEENDYILSFPYFDETIWTTTDKGYDHIRNKYPMYEIKQENQRMIDFNTQSLATSFENNPLEDAVMRVIRMNKEMLTVTEITNIIQKIYTKGNRNSMPGIIAIAKAIESGERELKLASRFSKNRRVVAITEIGHEYISEKYPLFEVHNVK